jgi:hypothetical protein
MTEPIESVEEQLRAWAKGSYNCEAPVEMLIRGFGGRFAQPGNPWIKTEDDWKWIDFEKIPENVGALSGGERAYLLLAASLGTPDQPADLYDLVSRLDVSHMRLFLAAVAHANGMRSLHPWPVERPKPEVVERLKKSVWP